MAGGAGRLLVPIKKSCHARRRVNAWLIGSYRLSSAPWSAPNQKPVKTSALCPEQHVTGVGTGAFWRGVMLCSPQDMHGSASTSSVIRIRWSVVEAGRLPPQGLSLKNLTHEHAHPTS